MELSDPAGLYANTRTTAISLFRSFDDEQAATVVPLTPAWTVRDVAAHVCGIVDDVLAQNVSGLGTDAWTADQVDKRSERTLAEICDEWEGYGPAIDEMIGTNLGFGVRITGDLIIHVHDVQHALGLPIDGTDEATRAAAHRYVPSLQERAAEQGLAVAVDLIDGDVYAPLGDASPQLTLRVTSYDFVRSVTGRRSRAQVEALDWSGDPTALIDGAWNTYGALPTADVSA